MKYVSDSSENCIMLFDLDLNQLKQYGSRGAGNNRFSFPYGLCCHGDYLYICDRDNKRIQIFSLDFEYVNTIHMDGGLNPYTVQISNTTIGVSCKLATLFYDITSRELKFKHNATGTYNINYIDSTFCALNILLKKMYFFDSDGNYLEEKAFHEKLILSHCITSGSMCRYKNQLYMIDHSSGKILKFLE